ncbi:palmitoyltransferase akr1 [Histoplasma capsulatum H143]|uniref:Palmitoyltransferase n=1 Tax=Ajellomyces capsulatus (strain H143) TaxID=544712 RepID=C6HT37_AJECH|nr:palmitoyltransferase akr1 [Histoplasma capsulatum H143]
MSSSSTSRDAQSSVDRNSSSTSLTTGKAAAAPPKLSTRENELELKDIKPEDGNSGNPKPSLPIEEDIMQLARLGEIAAIQKLFESGKFNARYADEEGITPLHWAAINNRYALCKFLLESGADVNAKGGESVATAAMWAAQRCHYYIVNLLLQHGADPLSTDIQGYNILHLATIDGNAFLLVLLLHQEIPVDSPDPQGHTGLMWAAYKGFPACVDLFLRWGANVNAVDEGGLSPLHWALVKGSPACVQKIIEYGADRFAKTRDGKTPATVAAEMKTVHAWYRALNECGYDREGNLRMLPFGLTTLARTKRFTSKFFFFWPFLVILFSIFTLSNTVIYIDTYSSHPFLNFFFIIFFGLTTYFYGLAMLEDPGFVPKLGSRNQQRDTITQLFDVWKFDEDNFCVYCMIRKPLRSKHCRRCKRCVSKHDHHCPWIDNCVGANNLRHFILYIFSMEIGIIFFIQLVMAHIDLIPARSDAECNILSSVLCDILSRDTFTIILTIWISIQLIWVSMLCVVQLVQISRNQTTYESMHGHTLDYANSASAAVTSAITTGTTSADIGGLSATGQGPNPAIPPTTIPSHRRPPPLRHDHGCLSQWKKLLGLDTFVATAQDGLDRRGGARSRNPFSRGVVTNCKDFWCDSQPYFGKRDTGSAMLGGETVNYSRLFDMPLMTRTGGSRAGSGMVYRSVAGEDAV